MKDKHITEVLDNAALATLSASELAEIRAHVQDCEACRKAFAAAQVSAVMIKERAQVAVEPSPFFQTRVMAAWREQQAVENVPAIVRLWRSSRALVSSMALATVALGALSFMVSAPATATLDQTASSAYSVDSVMFGQDDDQLSYDQVLNAIYTDDEGK
jgi:predicted anti-sigma-YlaC factor YlaD